MPKASWFRKPISFWVPVVFGPIFLAFGVYECVDGQIVQGIKDFIVGIAILFLGWVFRQKDLGKPV